MLKSLNFCQYFKDAMTTVFNTQINMDILALIDNMTNIEGVINFLAVKEMLTFSPEFIYNGLVDAVVSVM